ncbi:MAG TPA: hypothetical protein VNK91_02070 [Burkholderiaceae bacterium]|nr:hypothetical protein [Burkholderiaceae bacterium]
MALNDPPNRFLVIGTHRQNGGLYVWCGVAGFEPVQNVQNRGLAAQMVNRTTAEDLVRQVRGSASDYKFEVTILPVRDLTYERPAILWPH